MHRFHDLRRSRASFVLANGVPMKMIQDWLGHSDMGTTASIYSHIDRASKLERRKIDRRSADGSFTPERICEGVISADFSRKKGSKLRENYIAASLKLGYRAGKVGEKTKKR